MKIFSVLFGSSVVTSSGRVGLGRRVSSFDYESIDKKHKDYKGAPRETLQ